VLRSPGDRACARLPWHRGRAPIRIPEIASPVRPLAGEPGPAGPPGPARTAGGSGLGRIVGKSANNSESHKSAVATCPDWKKVLGKGGFVQGGATCSVPNLLTDVVILATLVDAGLTSVQAIAAEEEPTGASWGLTASAIRGYVS
jgi:hypothetical protein